MRQKIKEDDIVDEFEGCAYCGNQIQSNYSYKGCCGEVHYETFFELKDGSIVSEFECEIIKEPMLQEYK